MYTLDETQTRVSLFDEKTQKDLSTARIALSLKGGKGIANTTITLSSYTPTDKYSPVQTPTVGSTLSFTSTKVADVILLDGEFPSGTYRLNIYDGCLGKPLDIVIGGATLKQLFPLGVTYNNCTKQIAFSHNNPWTSSSYRYWESQKLELSFTPKNKDFTTWYQQKEYKPQYNIIDQEIAEIQSAGGYKVAYRYADRPEYICEVADFILESSITLKAANWNSTYIQNRECNTWRGYAPWFDLNGTPCEVRQEIHNKATGELLRTYYTLRPEAEAGWPYSTDLVATLWVDGVKMTTKEFRVDRQPINIQLVPTEDRYHGQNIDVVIRAVNVSEGCLPVLRITDQSGKVVYNQRMTAEQISVPALHYDTSYSAAFYDDEDNNTPITQNVVFARSLPQSLYMYGWNIKLCNHEMEPWITWDNGYGQGNTKQMPIGSVWTFEAVDTEASALPYKYIYQFTPSGYFYLPTGTYPPGKYKVTIDSTDDSLRIYTFDFAGGYQKEKPLRMDISNECSSYTLIPRDGTYTLPSYPQVNNNAGNSVVLERRNQDGTWTKVTDMQRNVPYVGTLKGHYRASMGGCLDNAVEFDLGIPEPKLKFYSTFSYYCGKKIADQPSQAGTILIEVESGQPPYTYRLYEYDASKSNGLGTLVREVTNQPLGQQVAFKGLSVKSYVTEVVDACQQYFYHRDVMRPFRDVAKAFVRQSEVCQGEPIQLFTYQLKDVEFQWSKVGDDTFTHPDADKGELTIQNASPSDAGTYELKVRDTTCDSDNTYVSQVHVNVVPQFTAFSLTPNPSEVCWQEPIRCSPFDFVGGKTPYTYEWQWRKSEGSGWITLPQHQKSQLSFIPPINEAIKELWVRCLITDGCGTVVTSAPRYFKIYPCFAPVNPHLMQRVQ